MASDQRKKPIRGKKDQPAGALKASTWVAGALVLILVASLGVYAYYRSPEKKNVDVSQMSNSDKLAVLDKEIEDLRNKIINSMEEERYEEMYSEDLLRLAMLEEAYQEKKKSLPKDVQDVFTEAREDRSDEREDERLTPRLEALFTLPPEERVATVSKFVDSMAEAEQRWRRPPGDRPPGGGPRGANDGAQGRQGRRGSGAGGGSRGGDFVRHSSASERQRDRTRARLSHTTPEYRAQRAEFVRMVQQERENRGLPPASNRFLFGMFGRFASDNGLGASSPPAGPRQ